MVVGGGVGGMQAALDLANSGFKVYLVEESTAIGGRMAQLDKTFPTNDCSMCTISPKLVETGRHLNIQLMMDSEVMKVDGQAGNFSVTVRHKPRYIDISKCTGCSECAQVCPIITPEPLRRRHGPAAGGLQALSPGRAQRLRHREARHRSLPGRLPGRPAGPGVHRPHPGRPLRRRHAGDQGRQPLPGNLRAHLQPPLRGGLQPQPGGPAPCPSPA